MGPGKGVKRGERGKEPGEQKVGEVEKELDESEAGPAEWGGGGKKIRMTKKAGPGETCRKVRKFLRQKNRGGESRPTNKEKKSGNAVRQSWANQPVKKRKAGEGIRTDSLVASRKPKKGLRVRS